MKLAYNLGKEISGQKILQDISKLVSEIPKDNLKDTVLVISLVRILDLEQTNSTLNIEYKQPDCSS